MDKECEWQWEDGEVHIDCKDDFIDFYDFFQKYQYCPYCGKKINLY